MNIFECYPSTLLINNISNSFFVNDIMGDDTGRVGSDSEHDNVTSFFFTNENAHYNENELVEASDIVESAECALQFFGEEF